MFSKLWQLHVGYLNYFGFEFFKIGKMDISIPVKRLGTEVMFSKAPSRITGSSRHTVNISVLAT